LSFISILLILVGRNSCYGIAVLAWIFFASNCRGHNYALLLTSSAILGFTLLPIIPATIVNSVECVYPVPEDIALGLLYISANTLAILMTFIGQVGTPYHCIPSD
jgi:hypothetical protein